MAEEIQEAVQIIRVAYDGIEIAMKVGSGGIAAMQKAIDFLKGMLDYEKSLGKTSMRKLILKGGDLQVLQFNTEDMKKVEKMAKKYGILYSVLPDCNRKDGLSEVIFHTEAVPRVNMMIQKLKFGKIATFDDYLKNGDEKSLGKLMDFLKKQQGNEKSHTIEGDRVNTAIDGLIEKVGWGNGFGNMVILKHSGGLESMYSHLSGFASGAKRGARVKQGQVIGYVGATGYATGPHLDFRLKQNGKYVNPAKVVAPRGGSIPRNRMNDFKNRKALIGEYLSGKRSLSDYKR